MKSDVCAAVPLLSYIWQGTAEAAASPAADDGTIAQIWAWLNKLMEILPSIQESLSRISF